MNIAIVGATGLVGQEVLKILFEKKLLKNNNIFLYASEKSKGKKINIGKYNFVVQELSEKNLQKKYDFALFSAGKEISLKWAKIFNNLGAIVIDNSSAFRRNKDIPLIVPEINAEKIKNSKIIANPNCSTIGASLPIFAMSKLYKIRRIIISTYQAVSGAGQKGINDLNKKTQLKFNYKIYNNLIPQIDTILNNGYTFEEDKMEFELKKILNNNYLNISTTCVRVPVKNCHSESINVEFEEKPSLMKIKNNLSKMKGIQMIGGCETNLLPMPILADEKNDVFVGRFRKDTSCKNAINFFICFDNIRKGAALNAVQIMEEIISRK